MLIVTLLLQPMPVQPPKVDPPVGVGVSVTAVPLVNVSEQRVAGQSMLPGLEVTVPVPPPAMVMVRVCVPAGASKVAVQLRSTVIVTLLLQPVPVQPPKVDPPVGVGASVTAAPVVNVSEQRVAGQSMLPGLEVTVPVPPPAMVMVRVCVPAGASKVAVQLRSTVIVTLLLQPVPVQPPKVDPPVGVGVSVTAVPVTNPSEQVPGQLMLPGFDVTVPVPPPAMVMFSVRGGMKFAVQVRSAVMVTLAPQSVPLQLPKVELPVGVGVSATVAPSVNVSLQVPGQLILPGLDVTVPVPPDMTIVRVRMASNVAVHPTAADIVTVPSAQSASPVQPANVDEASGVAVSVTMSPLVNASLQLVAGQSMLPVPPLEVTVPDPVPLSVTARVFGGITSNVAAQLRSTFIVTLPSVQSASPLHPANVEPLAGVGMRLTAAPMSNASVQSLPQSTPAGLVVTVPEPVPFFDTVNVKVATGLRVNVAVQVRVASIVTWPSLQSASPVHPANIDPALAVGVSVTTVPSA